MTAVQGITREEALTFLNNPDRPSGSGPAVAPISAPRAALPDVIKELQEDAPCIISSRVLMHRVITTPPLLIDGLLHQGSKLVLGGGSKTHKTWCLLDLALSVAAGASWWGHTTHQGRVLYVNLEIQDGFFKERLLKVKASKGLDEDVLDSLDVLNLRGHCTSLHKILGDYEKSVRQGQYAMIIIDPLYKVLGDADENSAGDMAKLLNQLERLAVGTGAAVVYAHHFSKGNQSRKESIDRMSGSGVFARDADSLLVMTKHEDEGTFVIEPTLRNFRPLAPFCVSWNESLMVRDPIANPKRLKQSKANSPKYSDEDLLMVLTSGPLTHADFKRSVCERSGMSDGTFSKLLRKLRDDGALAQDNEKRWFVAEPTCNSAIGAIGANALNTLPAPTTASVQ